MGKQINYYMEYEAFLKIAQAALDSGCVIVKDYDGKITGKDISVVTPDCTNYFFHLPEAGELGYKTYDDGRTIVDYSYTASGNSLIEAGYSLLNDTDKEIHSSRLFCISGYYDKNDEWIARPDCITKLYNKLVRIAKKQAPYTEVSKISLRDGQKYMTKEYISPLCLELTSNKDYKLK
ncbi:MAG: hypothetical protein IKK42_02485 [Oscillospiraceae bacterium]|nr:hypothetical protein [Oscillospiraceae bacterium]